MSPSVICAVHVACKRQDMPMWLCRGAADDSEADTSGQDDMDSGGEAGQEHEGRKAGRRGAALPGEDRFMHLDDMEAFLQDAERTADNDAGAFQEVLGVAAPCDAFSFSVSICQSRRSIRLECASFTRVFSKSPGIAQTRTKLGGLMAMRKAGKMMRRRRRYLWEHRHWAGVHSSRQGLQAGPDDAGVHVPGAARVAAGVWRRAGAD